MGSTTFPVPVGQPGLVFSLALGGVLLLGSFFVPIERHAQSMAGRQSQEALAGAGLSTPPLDRGCHRPGGQKDRPHTAFADPLRDPLGADAIAGSSATIFAVVALGHVFGEGFDPVPAFQVFVRK